MRRPIPTKFPSVTPARDRYGTSPRASWPRKTGIKVKYMPFDGAAPASNRPRRRPSHRGFRERRRGPRSGPIRQSQDPRSHGHEADRSLPRRAHVPGTGPRRDVRHLARHGHPERCRSEDQGGHHLRPQERFRFPDFQATAKKMGLNLVYKDEAGFTEFLAKNAADVEAVMKTSD